jgi:uncharacterized protein YfbU (UPF0304 family)
MKSPKLNQFQRQVLANQYMILSLLSDEGEDKKSYAARSHVFEAGYELMYFLNLDPNPLKHKDCVEVVELLDMFVHLKPAHAKVPKTSKISFKDLQFCGFDGNEETAQKQIAEFWCEWHSGFDSIVEDCPKFNSHRPTLPEYRRMLAIFKEFESRQTLASTLKEGFGLNADRLRTIIEARKNVRPRKFKPKKLSPTQ